MGIFPESDKNGNTLRAYFQISLKRNRLKAQDCTLMRRDKNPPQRQ